MIWLQDSTLPGAPLPRCCDFCWQNASRSSEALAWAVRCKTAAFVKAMIGSAGSGAIACSSCSVRRANPTAV